MKHLSLTFLFVMAAVTFGFSQVKVRPGLKLGFNSSAVSNLPRSESKLGFQGAMFANVHFVSFYELQAEASFSNQGYEWNAMGESGDVDIKYIGFALSNKFFVVPNLGLHLLVGPSVEVNVSDEDADITPFDFSFFGGVGYEFPFGLGLELRYKQGIIDIRDGYWEEFEEGDELFDDNVLNGVLQFGVCYKFQF